MCPVGKVSNPCTVTLLKGPGFKPDLSMITGRAYLKIIINIMLGLLFFNSSESNLAGKLIKNMIFSVEKKRLLLSIHPGAGAEEDELVLSIHA